MLFVIILFEARITIRFRYGSHALLVFRLRASQSDEYRAEHGKHHGLDEAHQHLECGHEDTHDDTNATHAQEHANGFCGNEEDDAHQRDGNGVTSHDICEETDHECEGLCEDSNELDDRYERECLQGQRHVGPEDIFPIMLVSAELHHYESTQREEECHGDIASNVSSTGREWYEAHDVAGEDKEEASEQVRAILLVSLSHTRLDDIIHHIHHKHLNESRETFRSVVARLVLAVPACRQQDTEQEHDNADEHRSHSLGDGDIERSLLSAANQFYDLALIVALCGNRQIVRSHPVSVGIGLLGEFGTAEHMQACGTVDDHRQVDHHWFLADIGDVPLV